MPKLREYIIVVKDLVAGWEFLEAHNLYSYEAHMQPRWSWHLDEAQRFHRKRDAQIVLDRIKVYDSCQRAVLCPVDVFHMRKAIRGSR